MLGEDCKKYKYVGAGLYTCIYDALLVLNALEFGRQKFQLRFNYQ